MFDALGYLALGQLRAGPYPGQGEIVDASPYGFTQVSAEAITETIAGAGIDVSASGDAGAGARGNYQTSAYPEVHVT
jgi:hypothetical protein